MQRERMRLERTRARLVREIYPGLESIDIALRFKDPGGMPASDQRHTLFAASRAFLRFPCPIASCVGEFALQAEVDRAVAERTATRVVDLRCSGVRGYTESTQTPCELVCTCTLTLRSTRDR
jgi:hypothetical protein